MKIKLLQLHYLTIKNLISIFTSSIAGNNSHNQEPYIRFLVAFIFLLHFPIPLKPHLWVFCFLDSGQTIKRTSFPRLLSSVPMAEPELELKTDSEQEKELEPKPNSELEAESEVVDLTSNVRFDMNDGKSLFMCRLCRKHLVTWENCSHYV